ncbi:hypothetical protein [Vibrio barjaei]|uniref:hypothetical protein n=1 Tax=Vibrio barjaei TaxID=1676683 RepID=UPI002283D641|nr:hypothetical protein [Vibrio barjaei]MCY9874074.1 hypothetical protein [Vibrio barjaei]
MNTLNNELLIIDADQGLPLLQCLTHLDQGGHLIASCTNVRLAVIENLNNLKKKYPKQCTIEVSSEKPESTDTILLIETYRHICSTNVNKVTIVTNDKKLANQLTYLTDHYIS